jgi:hypothetical protein
VLQVADFPSLITLTLPSFPLTHESNLVFLNLPTQSLGLNLIENFLYVIKASTITRLAVRFVQGLELDMLEEIVSR